MVAKLYPFGMPMPNRQIVNGEPYRYAYQGQEKDPETGKEAFQLRLWDSRIGRWLTTAPYRQFDSPYLGMGNNPIITTDPDGGYCDDGNGNRIVCPDKYNQFENTENAVTPLFFLAKNNGVDLSNMLDKSSQPGFNPNNVFGFTAGQFMTSMKSEFNRNGSPEISNSITNIEKTTAEIGLLSSFGFLGQRLFTGGATFFSRGAIGTRLTYNVFTEGFANKNNFQDYNLFGIVGGTLIPGFGGEVLTARFGYSWAKGITVAKDSEFLINLATNSLNSKIHSYIGKASNSLGSQGAIKAYEHIFKLGTSSTTGMLNNYFINR